MTDPNSPLARFYPKESSFDLTWRTKEYGAIIHLPVMRQQDVIDAIAEWHCDDSLTEEEKKRNTPEPEYLFFYSNTVSDWPTPLDPSFFPTIQCNCKRTVMNPVMVYNKILMNAHAKTRSPVFPSLYPQYKSISHIKSPYIKRSDRDPTKVEYQMSKPVNTIIQIHLNYPPFYDTYQSIQRICHDWLDNYVYYDYPRYRVGKVIEVFSCEYGCKEDAMNEIHIDKLSEQRQVYVKKLMKHVKNMAYYGIRGIFHDIGSLDISNNTLMVRIRPVYHICRNQDNQELYPFLSHQHIDFPLCLTRLMQSPNILNSTCSLPDFSPYTLKAGDSIVYIGNEESDDIQLRGSVGKVTSIIGDSLTIVVTGPQNGSLQISDEQKWYSRYELEKQIPEQYRRLLPEYLQRYICPEKDRKVAMGVKPFQVLVREGLVQDDPDNIEKDTRRLPPYVYSYLACRVEKQKSEMRVQYSDQAVKLAQQFFQQFGDELLRSGLHLKEESLLGSEEEQDEVMTDKEEKSEGEEESMEGGRVSMEEEGVTNEEEGVTNEEEESMNETKPATESSHKELIDRINKWMEENIACYHWVPAYMIMASTTYKTRLLQHQVKTKERYIKCSRNDVLVHENQYNIISDVIVLQKLPSLGQRVVVIQHASIPFGSQGTVVGVNPLNLWLEVILDKPSYAGVSFNYDLQTEDCIGRCV